MQYQVCMYISMHAYMYVYINKQPVLFYIRTSLSFPAYVIDFTNIHRRVSYEPLTR